MGEPIFCLFAMFARSKTLFSSKAQNHMILDLPDIYKPFSSTFQNPPPIFFNRTGSACEQQEKIKLLWLISPHHWHSPSIPRRFHLPVHLGHFVFQVFFMEINSRRKNSLVDEDEGDLALFLLFLDWSISYMAHHSSWTFVIMTHADIACTYIHLDVFVLWHVITLFSYNKFSLMLLTRICQEAYAKSPGFIFMHSKKLTYIQFA